MYLPPQTQITPPAGNESYITTCEKVSLKVMYMRKCMRVQCIQNSTVKLNLWCRQIGFAITLAPVGKLIWACRDSCKLENGNIKTLNTIFRTRTVFLGDFEKSSHPPSFNGLVRLQQKSNLLSLVLSKHWEKHMLPDYAIIR